MAADLGTKLEPICGREAAGAAGSPQAKSRGTARDLALEPICGRDPERSEREIRTHEPSLTRDSPPTPAIARHRGKINNLGSPVAGFLSAFSVVPQAAENEKRLQPWE
jgi:hypothetical protein